MSGMSEELSGKLSLSFAFILELGVVAVAVFSFLALRRLLSLSLFESGILLSLVVLFGFLSSYFVFTRLTENTRTVREIRVKCGCKEAQEKIQQWLDKRSFETKERDDLILAERKISRRYLNVIFELTLSKVKDGCLVKGKFYSTGWGMPDIDFTEDASYFTFGKVRKEGYMLMSEFLEYLKKSES